MRKAERLPELELARQQEELYRKRFMPEKPKITLNYSLPKKKPQQHRIIKLKAQESSKIGNAMFTTIQDKEFTAAPLSTADPADITKTEKNFVRSSLALTATLQN